MSYTMHDTLLNTDRMPGLSSKEEIDKAIAFFQEYIRIRDIYLGVFYNDPAGQTLESKIDALQKTKRMRGFDL